MKVLTTKEALERLKVSQGTFFNRVKELGIRPQNYNPNLRKQGKSLWKEEDIEKLVGLGEKEKSEAPNDRAA